MQVVSTPPRGDAILHLTNSLVVFQALQQGDPVAILTSRVYVPVGGAAPFFPPGLYLVTSAFYAALGTAQWAALLSQLPFLALLGLSTYLVARHLAGTAAGVAAAAAALASPPVLYYTRNYFLDLPLAAAVAFNLAATLEVDGFRHRRWTLLWGFSLGLGALAKNTFVFWGTFPLLAMLVASARKQPRYTQRVLAVLGMWVAALQFLRPSEENAALVYGVGLAALAALARALRHPSLHLHEGLAVALATALWNLENLGALGSGGVVLVGDAQMSQFPAFDVKVAETARVLGGDFLPLLPLLLLLSAAWLVLQPPERRRPALFVLASGLAALVLNTAFVLTDNRYLLPAVGYLSALAFLWLGALPAWLAAPAVLAVTAGLGLQALPFLPGPAPEALRGARFDLASRRLLADPHFQSSPPGDYPDLEILRAMQASSPGGTLSLWGVSHTNDTVLQPRLMRYVAVREAVPLFLFDPAYRDGVIDADPRFMRGLTHLLVVTGGEEWPAPVLLASRLSEREFRRIGRFDLPGGEAAWLYGLAKSE